MDQQNSEHILKVQVQGLQTLFGPGSVEITDLMLKECQRMSPGKPSRDVVLWDPLLTIESWKFRCKHQKERTTSQMVPSHRTPFFDPCLKLYRDLLEAPGYYGIVAICR